MLLSGHVVIITGAARGMGEAVTRRCVDEGAQVLAVDRDPQVKDLAAAIGCGAYVGDVTDPELASQVVADVSGTYGALHGLVNVAGVHQHGSAAEVTDEQWARVLAVNLTAPMVWTRAAIPAMIAADGGSILSFASIAGSQARPNCAAYVASKAGLIGFSRSVAVDFGPHNIRSNTLSPGTVDTPMFREHEAAGGASRAEQLSHIYLGRLGTTDEIASTCAFLLSPGAAYISGVDLLVDGGRGAGT
jgi:NAD(P)-dependent dehydrogenase (short-subunit alcohol dehydrogenase family)